MPNEIATIEAYISSQPESAQVALSDVCRAICSALPDADGVITYNMPTFKLDGKMILHFAGWKKHYSIYPASEALVAKFKEELAPYKVVNATIQFPYTKAVPTELIEKIAEYRITEVAERENIKLARI